MSGDFHLKSVASEQLIIQAFNSNRDKFGDPPRKLLQIETIFVIRTVKGNFFSNGGCQKFSVNSIFYFGTLV